jgi:alkanesulfonate monooxygenase SsuD/methylene tetrahydromethanopterin reductase-like flavin-dependent oxidoreductase (luciferase family)
VTGGAVGGPSGAWGRSVEMERPAPGVLPHDSTSGTGATGVPGTPHPSEEGALVIRLGFSTFGHHGPGPGSMVPTARDALTQTIDLAVAAEELGLDGAYLRVHHFARQQATPFPVLAAIAARTRRIDVGTSVVDMRYENPLHLAEEAAQTDLISGGRLHLGISRGSPEHALDGPEAFGYRPPEGGGQTELAHAHTDRFLHAISGAGIAEGNPAMGAHGLLPVQPQSPGLADRVFWGSATRATARWTAERGMNLMSSTLLTEDTGIPFDELQAEQIGVFREAWAQAGHARPPQVSVSRSILPIVDDLDERFFGRERHSREQTGRMPEPGRPVARFGRTFAGEPDVVAEMLLKDAAVREADLLLITVPNGLGLDYNVHLLDSIAEHVAPAIGWSRAG